VTITTIVKARDEFRNVSVTQAVSVTAGLHTGAGLAWSTHATVSVSLLPAAGSMRDGLAAAKADGQRDKLVYGEAPL